MIGWQHGIFSLKSNKMIAIKKEASCLLGVDDIASSFQTFSGSHNLIGFLINVCTHTTTRIQLK